MARKIFMALAVALLLSGNAMAQSGPSEGSSNVWAQFVQWFQGLSDSQLIQWFQGFRDSIFAQHAPSSGAVQSVPELDGGMSIMALGLTFAVVALIREKRRTR